MILASERYVQLPIQYKLHKGLINMARYRRRYRSWRSRGYSGKPTKYDVLSSLFGEAVGDMRKAFLALNDEALDSLISDYGSVHGNNAERYARKTFPKWKSGTTKLSGQTLERLIELIQPYLEPEQRHDILLKVLKKHKPSGVHQSIRINIKDPAEGFKQIDDALDKLRSDDPLAFIPEHVMKAARWLYDDDMTAARAMLAEATRTETEILRENAIKEIALLKRTISSSQIKSANYSVKTPVGSLSIVAYTPSKCFVATACFGADAPETNALRAWRDNYLIYRSGGRRFIVWYYTHGEALANVIQKYKILSVTSKFIVGIIARFVQRYGERYE